MKTSLEDILKASFVFVFRRRLQDVLIKTNIFALLMRLQKMSSRRFQDVFKMSCENFFKTSSRRLQDVLKTSSKSLQDVLQKRLPNILKTSCKDVFKSFSRRIIRLNCLPMSRIYLGQVSEKFMVSIENLQV